VNQLPSHVTFRFSLFGTTLPDLVAFAEVIQTSLLHGGDMDEHVLAATAVG
jgi:hypothetical protein